MTTADLLARSRRISGMLIGVAERAKADFAAIVAEHGLTVTQARTLLFLGEPHPMGDLAGHLACDPSNVTGIANRLEAQGLVERVAGEDRRVRNLRLTAKGRRLRQAVARDVAARSTVTASLSVEEQDQLATLLGKLLDGESG
jgi:DNA-binding MarR family transcriptional regulator